MARYRVEMDLTNVNDSRCLALGRVPARSRVLDIGIGDGTMARTLRKMGCRVWGVEFDKDLADESRSDYEDILVGDVERLDLGSLTTEPFDVILALDVLEHLQHPDELLRRLTDHLAEGGHIVVSLPNVTHAAVKLQLVAGRFPYTDEGLLDATHLRFFDREGAEDLLTDAGFEVIDLARVTRAVGETEIEINIDAIAPEVLQTCLADAESMTYQFVLTAFARNHARTSEMPLLPAMVLQTELLALQREIGQLTQRPWLDATTIDWIQSELSDLRSRELGHQRALTHLVEQVLTTMKELHDRVD